MKINNFFVKTFMITLFSLGNSAYSLSLEDAETKANEVCAACHGKDGITACFRTQTSFVNYLDDSRSFGSERCDDLLKKHEFWSSHSHLNNLPSSE